MKEGYGNSDIPDIYHLSQNYPNPFNTFTTIEYSIRGNPNNGSQNETQVRIDIYNLMGQKVCTLLDESQIPGAYCVVWDGVDDSGREVGMGVYVYRIVCQDFIREKKCCY